MVEYLCRRCRQLMCVAACEMIPADGYCGACQRVIAAAPPESRPAPVYGWAIRYSTFDAEEHDCHYVGSLRAARRKTMMRPKAKTINRVEGLTEEQWLRVYGRREVH